jgi:oligopeptide transport system substrate-binding protein
MIRLLLIPVILIALITGGVYWSNGAGSQDRADFAFVNRGDNKSLDLNEMSWMQDIRLAYALWEGLFTLDPVTLKPILGTADKATIDPTHRIWTIHIRPDARWSNGDPVLARDFIFSWRRFLETPGQYTYLHYYINGARQYAQDFASYVEARGKGSTTRPAPDFSTVGEVESKDDPRTLIVTLEDPIPIFPALCAFPAFFPMHQASMQPFAEEDSATRNAPVKLVHYDQKFTRPPNLVTNGPYEMTEWSFKRRIRMTASKYYWDRANVKSQTIDQIYAEEPLAAFRLYDQGDVDWVAEADFHIAAAILEKHQRDDVHAFLGYGTYFYSINCLPRLPGNRPNPMVDIRVRQALAMAIDKVPIVRDVGRLGQPVARTYIPPGVFPGYPQPAGLPYDVPAAKKLLADAGYPNGEGFPHLTILFNSEGDHADIAQIIRNQWIANLGITMDLEGVEIKVFGQRLQTQQYDIARASWYGDYDDPTTFTDKYKSDSDDNDAKWINHEYDDLCAAAQKEPDAAKRLALLARAENLLLTEAPIIPMYTYMNAYLFRDNVKGLPLAPNAMVMFKSIYVVHDATTQNGAKH